MPPDVLRHVRSLHAICYRAVVSALNQAVSEQPSIQALVIAAGSGDRKAEAVLCSRFAAVVRTFWRRRLKTAEAVDEAAQDVFVRLVQALRTNAITEPERVGGFVLGICKNVARERARVAERRAALWQEFGTAIDTLDDNPAVELYQLAQLEHCLSQITLRSREVIRGSFVDGASAAELAARLDMSEGNVRVVRHRALEALRTCMTAKTSWEGPQ